MFSDLISVVFAGCSHPMEYVAAFMLFVLILDVIATLIYSFTSVGRR